MKNILNFKIWCIALALMTALVLPGCTSKEHKEVIALSKCMKAANYLGDTALDAAAEYRASTALKSIAGNARYAMEVGQELRDEAEPQGISTNPVHILKIAREWKSSSYCVQVQEEFDMHIAKLVEQHMAPVLDTGGINGTCQQYVAQHDIYWRPVTAKHRAQLKSSLKASLGGSLTTLKDFQREAVQKQLSDEKLLTFAGEVARLCQDGGTLANKIAQTKVIQTTSSPMTMSISAMLENVPPQRDCGTLPALYCESELRVKALDMAVKKSHACDRVVDDSDCSGTAEELVDHAYRILEKAALTESRSSLEAYLLDPGKYNGNAKHNITMMAFRCKADASRRGVREAASQDYLESTCIPQARTEYLQPQTNLLAFVNARLAQMESVAE